MSDFNGFYYYYFIFICLFAFRCVPFLYDFFFFSAFGKSEEKEVRIFAVNTVKENSRSGVRLGRRRCECVETKMCSCGSFSLFLCVFVFLLLS